MLLSMLAACVAFFVKFVSIVLEESLYALFQISTLSGILYSMIVVFNSRHEVKTIFDKLSTIYDDREYK